MNNEKLLEKSSQNSSYSPVPPYEETSKLSDEVVSVYLNQLVGIIDERIEKRLKNNEDIALCYTAEITSRQYTEVDDNGNKTKVLSGITVRYNDSDYADIFNESVSILSDSSKWIKICTYDGVNFYVLHRI